MMLQALHKIFYEDRTYTVHYGNIASLTQNYEDRTLSWIDNTQNKFFYSSVSTIWNR